MARFRRIAREYSSFHHGTMRFRLLVGLEMGIASLAARITSPENFSTATYKLASSGGAEIYLEVSLEYLSQLALLEDQAGMWIGCLGTAKPTFVSIMKCSLPRRWSVTVISMRFAMSLEAKVRSIKDRLHPLRADMVRSTLVYVVMFRTTRSN